MKTIKIKVEPSQSSIEQVATMREELRDCWNRIRVYALKHQCVDWYKWAEKQSTGKKLFPKFSLEGITQVPLMFSRKGAWNGASCQIAIGGPRWVKDAPNTIPYKQGDTIKYRHSVKLVEGDRPYKRIPIKSYEPPKKGFKGTNLNMGMINADRAREGLPELKIFSRYFYGLLADFEQAWAAYTDPKLGDRAQPRFKDGRRKKITCLSNAQTEYIQFEKCFDGEVFRLPSLTKDVPLELTPCDRTWKERLGNLLPRSYRLVKEPSGWYLCITVANEAEVMIPTVKAQQRQIAIGIKKGNPDATKEELAELRNGNEDYQRSKQKLEDLQEFAAGLRLEASSCTSNSQQSIKVNPGIIKIAKTSRLIFQPNIARYRTDQHIERLQQRLDVMRNCNDKRFGKQWKRGERGETKNEAKLQAKISRLHERGKNQTRAFNQKLSTRIVRMAKSIEWRDINPDKLLSTPEPILAESGTHWLPNGATRRTELNRRLKNAAIGQLQQLTECKAAIAGKEFQPA